ncbi:N-acetyl-gamma-glutamyl-phosphate reductase [Cesiribacter andamanensis]|uniref:N-acetyl-gamma-glutamyl-phosphate reductase n=1 Tax=Cesiribacter andamanensis AMV16 TaxID=1279009 RepID=M7NAW1_9BACT|nr:N-acetyl-gamma-glutamyl-phosphate reductase [Cesiribacter andamanensis]EMR04407.1 N-acetyl-gamma-glutamyl-phosphate reductase [Cesiribacter andamanensis AMV16]
MVSAGIAGGTGYTAGELIWLLLQHPAVELRFVHSRSQAGKAVSSVHTDLMGETDLQFSSELSAVEVLFLCLPHGKAREFLAEQSIAPGTRIIDLSHDHRLGNSGFVYGLPELNKEAIRHSRQVANPGCFATALQLALLPLARERRLQGEVHVQAITGATGAGAGLSDTTHFSWRSNNLSVYKAFGHQHLGEIKQSLQQLDSDFAQEINFIPLRGNFARGIFASLYTEIDLSLEQAMQLYKSFYADAPFVQVTTDDISLKEVVNTNRCFLQLQKHGKKLLILSAIDNLLKGASGQAVQNMNLMLGLDESTGLQLKPIRY